MNPNRGAKGTWRRVTRRVWSLLALTVIGIMTVFALFAELWAASLPIAVRIEGRVHVLPAWTKPPELRDETVQSLQAQVAQDPAGWLVAPLVPFGPNQTALDETLSPPDARHPLGTDELGRDVFARMVHGARVSLTVGLVAVALYVVIGVVLGLLAGYVGGSVDVGISRVTEVMLAFPTFFLVLAVMGLMRVESLVPVMVVIGLTRWTDVSRLVRAEVLKLRTHDFIEASRALGASPLRTLLRHVLPNALGPVWVAATFGIAGAILLETALSFLGFGVPPPAPSWGELLTQAHRYIAYPGAWWLAVFPGVAIFLTVTAFNLLGEGLRDALDPRMK